MTEIITRAQAKARGLKRYFTGQRCKRGHVAERHVGNGHCLECDLVYHYAYYAEHREKRLAYSRAYNAAHREKRRAYEDSRREKRKAFRRAKEAELRALRQTVREQGLLEPKTVSEAITRLAVIAAQEAQLTAMITKAATDPIDPKKLAPSIGNGATKRPKKPGAKRTLAPFGL